MTISLLSAITACARSTYPPTTAISTSSPSTATSLQVIATAWTAELAGTLDEVDGCLQVINNKNSTVYTLAWPPDFVVTVEGKVVKVIKGVVTGDREEVMLHIGDTVRLSGGETKYLNAQLQETVNENCPEPYWVVGFEINRFQTTEAP